MSRDVELGHHVAVERKVEPGRHRLCGLRGQGVGGGDSGSHCNLLIIIQCSALSYFIISIYVYANDHTVKPS